MGLATYQEKRNFRSTSEPKGKRKKTEAELIFVVQQHAASHLHYDFRLEMEGVLKSWAIPKGPSMNPDDKRLAVMVEDHPYDYKDFEGTIPEGNYGAGNVIVWDNGVYHAVGAGKGESGEKKLLEGLKKGRISFILEGKKLKGEFSLVKMKAKEKNVWLLIKKEDEFSTEKNILEKKKSVKSNRSLESLAKKNGKAGSLKSKAVEKKQATEKKVLPAVKKKALEKIKPMLAETSIASFDSNEWLSEIKYDGYRALANIENGKVELYSRNLNPFNEKYPAIVQQLETIPHAVILDGEIVVEDKEGRSGFQLLQNRLEGKLKYYVFDLLHLNGYDLFDVPLIERKNMLRILLENVKMKDVVFSKHVIGNGLQFYKDAVARRMEGIISKEIKSRYRPGQRSKDWLKIKILQQQEMVIAGITKPKGSRSHFGSIVLAVRENNRWKYAGHCGAGFSDEMLSSLYKKFKPLFTPRSPFTEKVRLNNEVQWLRPEIVCEIKFTEWTSEGNLRHPVFMGLRTDKKASEVKRENPTIMVIKKQNKVVEKRIPEPGTKKGKGEKSEKRKKEIKETESSDEKAETEYDLKIGKINLHFTNQNKIYWPVEKYTKRDLIGYYDKISAFILPYLKDRPESMNRFPNGINKPSFYQKDVDREKVPSWLKTEKIYSESNKEEIDYLVCNDKATLLYMANLGCIEINPWNSRIGKLDFPDWIVIDLDPDEISFKEVVRTALTVKETLDDLAVNCYCKTSGATGLHIYIPLTAKYDYKTARIFAELIAGLVHDKLPDITSLVRNPSKRKGKIYLDFLQNSKGQTLAAPYAVRPRPGATVSTPLSWKEVNDKLDPTQFTIRTIPKRIEKIGDIWKPVIGKGENIFRVLKKLYKMQEQE
jgi:bifunctional non-homologous end joining protein LigD